MTYLGSWFHVRITNREKLIRTVSDLPTRKSYLQLQEVYSFSKQIIAFSIATITPEEYKIVNKL